VLRTFIGPEKRGGGRSSSGQWWRLTPPIFDIEAWEGSQQDGQLKRRTRGDARQFGSTR
jgi:hypothetical protein